MKFICRICSLTVTSQETLAQHLRRCVETNAEFVDSCRPAGAPFEGDPELAAFARAEGSVYNRAPGNRRRLLH